MLFGMFGKKEQPQASQLQQTTQPATSAVPVAAVPSLQHPVQLPQTQAVTSPVVPSAEAVPQGNNTHQIIQQLEEIIIRLQTSINSLKIGFVIVDTNGEIVNMNDGARALLCSEFGKPVAQKANHICTIPELGDTLHATVSLTQLITECLQNRKNIVIHDIPVGDRFIYLRLYPIMLGGSPDPTKNVLTGVTLLFEDVTQEKIAQRSRDEFFVLASHELRTPLTAIRGNAALVKEYYRDIMAQNNDLKEMVDDIHDSSAYLITIVNQFLDVSRLEQGKMVFNRELFNLLDPINTVIHDVKYTAQEKNLSITLENTLNQGEIAYVIADMQRTREVIYNLVGNAIKYTDTGGLTISVMKQNGSIITKVRDTGRGIPHQNQNLLFRKFQQAGRSFYTRDVSRGTGLGLYISKLLANHMNGELYLESSEENKGSVFAFALPLATELEIKMLSPQQMK